MRDAGVTAGALLAEAGEQLRAAGVATPSVDARWIVRHVLGWSDARLMTDPGTPLDARQIEGVRRLAQRRAAREPLQLVLGSVSFLGLELLVRPGVFIPRPETELLAEEAIVRAGGGRLVVEPCTGTGAVACAVASRRPRARVHATDADRRAVALATHNAARLGVSVDVRRGDLLAPLPSDLRGKIDVLVSNPPYLAENELAGLEPEVARWEPPSALVAGPTGHEVSDRLLRLAGEWLRPGGWLLLEVDERRTREVARRAGVTGLVGAEVRPDLTGRDRIVIARSAHHRAVRMSRR